MYNYTVVRRQSLDSLITAVLEFRATGWHPVGGVTFIEGAQDLPPCTYLQPMVREPAPVLRTRDNSTETTKEQAAGYQLGVLATEMMEAIRHGQE